MKALAAGASIRAESAWIEPVRAPDAMVHCGDGVPDRPLHALHGDRLRIVAGGARIPAADPRFVTVLLEPPGSAPSIAPSSDCVVRSSAAWAAYAEVSGASPDRFFGTQLLVDRDGWLRAYGAPGKTAWSQGDLLCSSTRLASATSTSRDGLGDLIAAIDADPVRSGALGIAHTP
jgi:hypothetical protein